MDDASDNFIAEYGEDDEPAILDAWGKPLVIQDANNNFVRLVSLWSYFVSVAVMSLVSVSCYVFLSVFRSVWVVFGLSLPIFAL